MDASRPAAQVAIRLYQDDLQVEALRRWQKKRVGLGILHTRSSARLRSARVEVK